jgi:hypothetical protein
LAVRLEALRPLRQALPELAEAPQVRVPRGCPVNARPICPPPSADELRLARMMAPRYDELDAWRALYDALCPAPARRAISDAAPLAQEMSPS